MRCTKCGSEDLIYDGDGNTICLKCGFLDTADEDDDVPNASDRGDTDDDDDAPVGCFDQLAEY